MWDEFDKNQDFDFFCDIQIARDGGFSEVNELWYPGRWVSALAVPAYIMANLWAIISLDVQTLLKSSRGQVSEMFVLNQSITRQLGLQLPLPGCAITCVLELVVLAVILLHLLALLLRSLVAEEEWSRWGAIESVFWKTLPELSTYSGMRLLHFASPSVLVADIIKFGQYSTSRWRGRCGLLTRKWTKLVLTRAFCFVLGMDCFLVKVQSFSKVIPHAGDGLVSVKFLKTCMFLVQVLGIVQLQMFVKNRLFTFVFGGEDAVLQTREKLLKSVFNTMLVRAIWREHSCLRFCIIMMSFSDADLQRLFLNESSRPTIETTARCAPGDSSSCNSDADGESSPGSEQGALSPEGPLAE